MTARRPRTAGRQQRVTRLLTVLAVAAGILRNSRFRPEPVIVAAIVLAALAGLAKENQARTLARIDAWMKKVDQRAERAVRTADRVTADALEKATRHG